LLSVVIHFSMFSASNSSAVKGFGSILLFVFHYIKPRLEAVFE
jgi:hypothetical protein